MRRFKVLINFLRMPIVKKIAFYRNVISKMTGNATLPTPDVPLATAGTQTDALQAAYVASRNGGPASTAAMRDKEAICDDTFRKLALYVERIANGNETIILNSGFDISGQPAAPTKPELLVERGENSGSVSLQRKAVNGARSYIWQYAKDPEPLDENNWTTAGYSTRGKFVIDALTPGDKLWFRVAAVTPEGTTDYCNPVFFIVA